mmetsp:Transcript_68045/g.221541  ORF Transcript_68045/g.221541 Transcript_68045/m.221541 type:complete len:335 (+) Transcript_68045:211-1215(+)
MAEGKMLARTQEDLALDLTADAALGPRLELAVHTPQGLRQVLLQLVQRAHLHDTQLLGDATHAKEIALQLPNLGLQFLKLRGPEIGLLPCPGLRLRLSEIFDMGSNVHVASLQRLHRGLQLPSCVVELGVSQTGSRGAAATSAVAAASTTTCARRQRVVPRGGGGEARPSGSEQARAAPGRDARTRQGRPRAVGSLDRHTAVPTAVPVVDLQGLRSLVPSVRLAPTWSGLHLLHGPDSLHQGRVLVRTHRRLVLTIVGKYSVDRGPSARSSIVACTAKHHQHRNGTSTHRQRRRRPLPGHLRPSTNGVGAARGLLGRGATHKGQLAGLRRMLRA